MKRRALSFILVLALCLNLLPAEVLPAAAASPGKLTLEEDKTFDTTYVAYEPVTIETNGFTLTVNQGSAIQVTGTGSAVITGGGKVMALAGTGVEVQSGGSLSIAAPGTSINGDTYGLDVAAGGSVQLSAGTYFGWNGAIHVEDGNYAALLGEGCAFFNGSDPISPENLASARTLTVGQCTDHQKTYVPTSGAPTHSWTCPYCGTTETEKCTFDFARDGDGTSTCAACGNGLTIVVNQDDLSDLVYDGTLQPEEVGVTVTLTQPNGTSAALMKDRDFRVDIHSITDAGQATVTVTGITFNGTFVKTYTVEKAEPKIEWSITICTVNYDGQEVDNLPGVTITAVPGDDLSSKVRYAYKKTGDADFTNGLPTDAGTYEVKAYLEESDNYIAMETDPLLTLTIAPIAPIATAPAAKTLTFNRGVQNLVTAGTLDPVAVRDGLTIQFATSAAGPWSTDIPTETNAGNYTVWYQVTGLPNDNYIAPTQNPAQINGVEIQRKPITPVVTLSPTSFLYDGGEKQPAVTVKDPDGDVVLSDAEYAVGYVNNRNVSTDANPAKAVVTDKAGGNYGITRVEAEFKITSKTQDSLSIINMPNTFTYGDQFTPDTSGGSDNGDVTWEITSGTDVATVDASSGQVTIIGHGTATLKATKSGGNNYEDATATRTFTAVQKPVTATVTAEDKTYDGITPAAATVTATLEAGDFVGADSFTIRLAGTFEDENAGVDKRVDVDSTNPIFTVNGGDANCYEHYAITYPAAVTATIRKAVAEITTAPVPAVGLIYSGNPQMLIDSGAVVDPDVPVEYALSKDGPYSTDFPEGTKAGTYTVWYRVKETDNYTGLAPESIDVTIDKKSVRPTITLDQETFIYDGTPKEPEVTLKEADNSTVISVGEYTVAYTNNVNVGTATVTVTAKADGNYTFTPDPVTKDFTITQKQAQVTTAPAAVEPLTFNTKAQNLVTAGAASGGTMVYRVGDTGDFKPAIPTGTNAGSYKVYYKVKGDANHSDSDVSTVPVTVTIDPKVVTPLTIELRKNAGDTTLLDFYIYDGTAKTPHVTVKDGSTVIAATEYNIVYSNNTDAGTATVSITDKENGNYTVTGSTTFVIQKADIVFNPAPSAATITYDGNPHELLTSGTTSGGTVLYALGSSTAKYDDYIPTATEAGDYTVYYKVDGDENHNDFPITKVTVTIGRKELNAPTIQLTPNSFEYDGEAHLPTVTVKDGTTVLPTSEYTWKCYDNTGAEVTNPTAAGTYTITITDATGGNYDLTNANPNTATFTIGKAAQEELTIEGKPVSTVYGGSFQLTTSGGSGTGALTWNVTAGDAATVDASGNVIITGVGQVTITAEKAGDTNYEAAQAQWTFTAAPKPVTAEVTVSPKVYDESVAVSTITAQIKDSDRVNPTDNVTISGLTGTYDDAHVGTDKTVTLDTSKVQVTGDDAAKYDISYPDTVKADIGQATTTIDSVPTAIGPLTYTGQPLALISAGQTNVGFLVYSTDGTSFSRDIPTGTDAGSYKIYYKVEGTADYTAVGVNSTPISVTIKPKPIKPTVELSETSFLYNGTRQEPKITVKDGNTVIPESQYEVTWAGTKSQMNDDLLRIADTYTATIANVTSGNNYTFNKTAQVEIREATQGALDITNTPDHVYYGDTITTLKASGGTGNGTVKWSIEPNNAGVTIDETTGTVTVNGIGAFTITAERTVPNYATATGTWTFTVEPKPVTAEVTVAAKDYDGGTTATVASVTIPAINGDTVTVDEDAITATFDDPNAGKGKTVTLDSTGATVGGTDAGKYTVSYPDTAKGDINPRQVDVEVTLSDHDLKPDTNGQYYEFDGTEKNPTVAVTGTDASGYSATLAASDYDVTITDNKNVGQATVTVTAKDGGNYTFTAETVNFEIRSAAAVLTTTPQAKALTYEKGVGQELVTVGAADGGTVVYSLTDVEADYKPSIPKKEEAGTYTVYFKVKGDDNHTSTAPGQVTVTIQPKPITAAITLSGDGLTNTNGVYSYTYDGTAKTPTVTVKDGNDEIPATEYNVSCRDNINAGTATVTVSDANGGNYIVNGSATFEITRAGPTFTAPTAISGLYYTGVAQELVNAGVTSHGTVLYSVDGGNYSPTIPARTAVGTYKINWMVQGDDNHSDTAPAALPDVVIAKNTVDNPTISLSSNQFTYNGNQQKPIITVSDNSGRLIPGHEYVLTFTGVKSDNMVDVDTYTVTLAAAANSNYVFTGDVDRTFEIVPADQETISITGTKAQVTYGDGIQLGVSGGTGEGTIAWNVAAKDGNTISSTINAGLLTVKDVNTSIKVTVTRSKGGNYTDATASWEFTAAKKPVTASVTVSDKDYDSNTNATVSAVNVPALTGDTVTIDPASIIATFDTPNVGTGKTVTLTGGTVSGADANKYDVTIPTTATASILAVAATVDTDPAANTLTYDASQSQKLVTAGTANGGTMVYSLDGTNFTAAIPKAQNAGTYTVHFKAQGDQNHTDSTVGTVDVAIGQQTVKANALQIELSPPSARYDEKVHHPDVTVRDPANNVISTSEYKVTYVTDGGKDWTDVGTYTVKVENISNGNYDIKTATKDFIISTTEQNQLVIEGKPGLVYYGGSFHLSTSGGSGSGVVTWSSSNTSIAAVDANGLVTIKGTGPATITATKAGDGNHDAATATYPLNALQKPITAIVTADDREYKAGDTSATIHVTWEKDALVKGDDIDTSPLTGTFDNENVGTGKTVTITGDPVDDDTSRKYDITIDRTTTASITKATATAPNVTAVEDLVYDGTAKALVTGGDTNTRYSDAMSGVYSENAPQKTNAGDYTVWYKELGDANHNDSEPTPIQVTISPKALTAGDTNVTLSPASFTYDGTAKKPDVVIVDGSKVISSSEYEVSYSNNVEAGTSATVTITDKDGGNYTVSGSVTFEITKGSAQLIRLPQANALTYTGAAQELVIAGAATGGHIEYKDPATGAFGTAVPKATNAGTYTVDYKVVGDGNYADDPTIYSLPVTIQPKTVVSPTITVSGTYTYDGTAKEPGTNVMVADGGDTIPDTEYTLSYRDNVNAGTATVIITDADGGNYTVNGSATFTIGKAVATVGAAPTGKTGLKYNGTNQALLATAGSSSDGTVVYSLDENGEYSAAIPTGTAVGEYEVWYKVLGDNNHSDSAPAALAPKVQIAKNSVTNPIIQVEPASVKYTGEGQTPTVTVRDGDGGLLIDGSEYTVAYQDGGGNTVTNPTAVGTYKLALTANGTNYDFSSAVIDPTVTFTITPADQTALTITGTRERVYYGETVSLGVTGGVTGGAVTWDVGGSAFATIGTNTGLLEITGVGQVTVTATSAKTGYEDQTATWQFYADKKPVTALVTARPKTYNGNTDAEVTATLQTSDFVGSDNFTITLTGCTFEDANAGTDKKVNVDSTSPSFTVTAGGTNCYENYAISYPNSTTASISKADIEETEVTAPTLAADLEYTGLPLTLTATAGSAIGGTLEYSTDGVNYSAALPTGTDAKDYSVWYRVRGDGNHNDIAGKKLAAQDGTDIKVTIAPQTVNDPQIELTPSGASYDSQEHKPTVRVLDGNGREIPATEYDVDYGNTNWRDVGDHTVTIVDKTGGNYNITAAETARTKVFTILPAGQLPLSITGQPGDVRYGDAFILSATGGSGTGAVSWGSSDNTVAFVNSATGRVEIKKAGGPVTITARKAAGGGYGETTATWTFSAEKRPVTPIITAKDRVYGPNRTDAELVITWRDGDLLGNDADAINLSAVLTGAFDDANVGENKIVRISGNAPDSDKYAITIPRTTTASITAEKATVSGVNVGPWTYSGSPLPLLQGGSATNGDIVYSRNGVDFQDNAPMETDAGTYRVYYKARGNTNYADSDVRTVEVTIQPKTVTVGDADITLSQDSFEYDGTAKEPEVVTVKDGSNVIPANEYTVRYSNNTNVGTATVTINNVAGGNYTVSGSKTFTITAGAASLETAPQPRDLTYNGKAQPLVTAGKAVNGKVVYSLTGDPDDYSATIPKETNADTYYVYYKVVDANGNDVVAEDYVEVTIDPQEVTPTILLNGQAAYSVTYTGSAQEPTVTVNVGGETVSSFKRTYSNNTKVGTATVTVQSTGGNYKFFGTATFEITKGKASFLLEPAAKLNLVYTGEPQELVEFGMAAQSGLSVVYSTDNLTFLPAIPTATNRGNYVVIAKVQGNEFYEDSDPVPIRVTIGVNTLAAGVTIGLSANSFPHTGNEVKPTVTVTDKESGNVISADEYTVTYENNVNVGEATITIKSKTGGNYSFTATANFQIIDASQTPLTITGKKEGTVYYGDILSLSTTGGGTGAVTWSATGSVTRLDDGQYKVNSSGSVTITVTKGSLSDTWNFYAQPKPVTATVTAANKPYDGNTNATLTVTLSGLLPGETVNSVTAQGEFMDANVGTGKTVTNIRLTIPGDVSAKYAISLSGTTTASITPAPAKVVDTDKPALVTDTLTYNGGAQNLLANAGTAEGGNLMYSVGGDSYSYNLPTAENAGTYTVWYKVVAGDDNHKDSAAVRLGEVTINANTDKPTVLCEPSTIPYTGTEQTPNVVVKDSANRIIPSSEYTVELPAGRITTGTYTIKVTDKPGGNYEFSGEVTGTFKIVAASQNPLSITDKPTQVYYGGTFRLSAVGGTGNGAIHWNIPESSVATIDVNGTVTVKSTGGFTVEAYREASGGYSQSNTDRASFEAKPKPVTPVVTVTPKGYDGTTTIDPANITATVRSGDLVIGDSIAINGLEAVYDSATAGTNKTVLLNHSNVRVSGMNADRYVLNWPDSVTGTIEQVDIKLDTAPAGADLTYNKTAQALVTGGTTMGGIGTIEYATGQNGAYSTAIPTGTNAGTYTVWYKVADSVNYTGIAPAAIQVEIKKATPVIGTAPTASGTAGQKLSEIRLEGGATNTETGGTFAWVNGDITPVNGNEYDVLFTPNDADNYTTHTFKVKVTVSTPGGTDNTPDIPNTPSTPDNSAMQITAQGNTARASVSSALGSKLVNDAVANQSDSIVIKPEITGDVTKVQVSIPASTASQINSRTDADLTVSSPIADVTIPNGALNTLGGAGGTINVATEQVDGAVALTLTAGGKTVDSVPGGVTLTVPTEDAGPGTVAVLVNEDGTRQTIQKSVAKDGVVNIPLDGSATVEIVDNGKTFADVPETSWAAEAVTFASAHELFNGTSETTFSPEETTSRGMVATVLYRLEGQPDQALTDVYSDVSDDAWYADSVAWAAENGIVNGYGDGQFGPNDSVTREQFVVMLWRYVGSPAASGRDLSAFTDADQINDYALEALCWAVENGVLNGNGNGTLAPRGTTTRAEAAQMLKNFIENT